MRVTINAAATAGLVAVLLFPLMPAAADSEQEIQEKPEQPAEITPGMLADSVARYTPAIAQFSADGAIEELGAGDPEEENVIVLEADILFSSNEWDLPSSAAAKIAELAEEVPDDASVEVHGHTDSLPVDESQFDFDNQELSENRAQAVAEVLADERSDLSLDVEGFGDTEPAVTEDEEDPSTFAANRRVEIRYGD